MPRNSSGVMTYNSALRGVAGQTLTAAMINGAQDDTANELTQSLPRDGRAPMTGPLPLVAGSLSDPGLGFSGVAGTGLYWDSVNSKIVVVVGGVAVAAFDATGLIAGIPDGDRGDITVDDDGATWEINDEAVTLAKIQDLTSKRLLGRASATDGVAEQISLAARLSLSDAGVLDAIIRTPVRHQSVNFGPIDSNGLPTFWPASSGTLSLTAQNISASVPLVVSAKQGADFRIATITAAPTWTPGASATSFAYLEIDPATLAATAGLTTLAPIYQWGGTPSTTFGQHTYIITEGVMYLGNGSTADKVWRVFVGEMVTSGSAVTSATEYAYNGRYRSPLTSFQPAATELDFSHNIGVYPVNFDVLMQCIDANLGYSVGHITRPIRSDSGVEAPLGSLKSRLLISTGWITTIRAVGLTGGGAVADLSKWQQFVTADRGWD